MRARGLSYDSDGNLQTDQAGNRSVYDAENYLTLYWPLSGTWTIYYYEGLGNLLKRRNPDGSSVIYIGGIYERTFDASGNPTGTTKYYMANRRRITMRTAGAAGAARSTSSSPTTSAAP